MANKRQELRDKLFTSAKRESIKITFFGQEIELRQPDVGSIIDDAANPDKKSTSIHMLVDYAYVPGTDEKVFDEADIEVLRSMPWGKDFTTLTGHLRKLTGLEIEEQEKN